MAAEKCLQNYKITIKVIFIILNTFILTDENLHNKINLILLPEHGMGTYGVQVREIHCFTKEIIWKVR